MFSNKNITIFGGTGSIGTLIAKKISSEYPSVEKITLFSNNENELWESRNLFAAGPKALDLFDLRFGDIRDKKAVKEAIKNADFVFNCAALKHIGFCERSPIDAVLTNLLGLQNIIDACNKFDVELMVQISTDKAVEPTSVMGATKLIGERMCKDKGCHKVIIRLGNVLGSRGSLIPQMEKYLENDGKIYITNPKMKRYFIEQDVLANFIIKVCKDVVYKEGQACIYIPKMTEYPIMDVVNEFLGEKGILDTEIVVFGAGEAEKLTESLFTQSESNLLIEHKDYYVIIEGAGV